MVFDKIFLTPVESIRLKCLDCSGYQRNEIRLCTVAGCPLYPYRMGARPTGEYKREKPAVARQKMEEAFNKECLPEENKLAEAYL